MWEIFIFDELFLRNTNTRQTLDVLWKRYGSHQNGWVFYGDATGKARKTSASFSDFAQIRNDKRFLGRQVRYPAKNPLVVDRFAACNALFRNASGDIICYIHPKCNNLARDLEDRVYKEGTREPDDYADIGHMTDALGYIIYRRFPIRLEQEDTSPKVFTNVG